MIIQIYRTSEEMGQASAKYIAEKLNACIRERNEARLLVSTGASQFPMFKHLIHMPVDFSKVTMFHLDEYINLPVTHPASFRKYLKERFVNLVNLKEAVFVSGEGDVSENIRILTERIREAPIDIGLIGIGENGHIAFNDPPADFETEEAYHVVNLDDRCKQQQVREGWFATADDVPKQAISMTVKEIMKCKSIISIVPYPVKADAVKKTLTMKITPMVPATILKSHDDFTLFLDADSAKEIMTF